MQNAKYSFDFVEAPFNVMDQKGSWKMALYEISSTFNYICDGKMRQIKVSGWISWECARTHLSASHIQFKELIIYFECEFVDSITASAECIGTNIDSKFCEKLLFIYVATAPMRRINKSVIICVRSFGWKTEPILHVRVHNLIAANSFTIQSWKDLNIQILRIWGKQAGNDRLFAWPNLRQCI